MWKNVKGDNSPFIKSVEIESQGWMMFYVMSIEKNLPCHYFYIQNLKWAS
jgi:hypothetical protein